MTFSIKIKAAPDHSNWTFGKMIKNKNEVAILNDKPKVWKTKTGAQRYMQGINWPGYKFEIVEE